MSDSAESHPSLSPQRSLRPCILGVLSLGLSLAWAATFTWAATAGPAPPTGALQVVDFLPAGYVTDGSVCYQQAIQKAIDTAAAQGKTLLFRPMEYLLSDETGLALRNRSTLYLYGAVFRMDKRCQKDGQAFVGRDVSDVTLLGGEVAGQRTAWPDSVNVAGVRFFGPCARIRIRDTYFHDLSSNGVGVFGKSPDRMAEDVWLDNVIVRRCCNKYIDYLRPHQGPVKGSQREDQGGVAFYFVRNFAVTGCSLEDSRSDGTHFYRCADGRFIGNRVIGSTMGGYFVETGKCILAADNIIRDNGSRGVTIEAGSYRCTLRGNVIEQSGREGLWAPDSIGVVVTGNVFRHNGRKDHDDLDGEIMVNESNWDPPKTPRAEDYQIARNIFYTTAHQGAAIRVLAKCDRIVIENNTLRGPVRQILVDVASEDVGRVVVRRNEGWRTESAGTATFDGDGKTVAFRIPHGLDFVDPLDPRALESVEIVATVTAASPAAAGNYFVSADTQHIVVTFGNPPPAGKENVKLHWSAQLRGRDRP